MSDHHWSYLDSSKQKHGPFTREALLKLVANGVVAEHTYVWSAGMTNWQKFSDVKELHTSENGQATTTAGSDTSNILTQRLAGSQPSASTLSPVATGSGMGGFLKIAAIVLLIGGIVWANSVFHFLPGSSGKATSNHPDRWFSEDNREGAIIQCTIDRKGSGSSGGVRYRLTAIVSAGVARGRRLPIDTTGNSQVVIRDSEGNIVFNQAISNAKLCPS